MSCKGPQKARPVSEIGPEVRRKKNPAGLFLSLRIYFVPGLGFFFVQFCGLYEKK